MLKSLNYNGDSDSSLQVMTDDSKWTRRMLEKKKGKMICHDDQSNNS